MTQLATPTTTRIIYPGAIAEPKAHETAREAVRFLISPDGKPPKRNRATKDFITADELVRVEDAVQRHNNGEAIPGLENLPTLRGPQGLVRLRALEQLYRRPIEKEGDRAAFSAALIDTFWSPEIQETARAIADKHGNLPDKNYIDIGAIERAWGLALSDQKRLFAEVPELANIPKSTAYIEYLKDFMDLGKNGLAEHGPFTVNGRVYSQIFRLQFLPQYPQPASTLPQDQFLPQLYQVLESTINEYENRFKETGYDRVYVLGQDKRLYVAIRDEGIVKNVTRGDKGTFAAKSLDEPSAIGPSVALDEGSLLRNVGTPGNVGEVLKVIDVSNNVKESAFTYFRNLLLRTVRDAQKSGNETNPLVIAQQVGSTPSNGPSGFVGGQGARQGSWTDVFSRIGWFATFAGIGGVGGGYLTGQGLLSWGAVVGALIAVSAALTIGAFAVEQRITPRTILPFYSAAGLTSNRESMRADYM